MRIQHNIAALNSYRNLTNNNSAVAKNLEKLSSGYRINRAGDDAAGLAISEKMRAQITGLETAQKNAQDGISLVQTAEGALTEVHSMLNRMVELADQSANGTYQNEVDRENLQKEINSLKSEIDRISESTNFNGIDLLNGKVNATDGVKTGNLVFKELDAVKAGELGTIGDAKNNGVLQPNTKEVQYATDIYFGEFTNSATTDDKTFKISYDVDGGTTKKDVTFTLKTGATITTQDVVDALNGNADLNKFVSAVDGGTTNSQFKDLYDVSVNGNQISIKAKASDGTIDASKSTSVTIDTTGLVAADVTAATDSLKKDDANAGTATNIAFGVADTSHDTKYQAAQTGNYERASVDFTVTADSAAAAHNTSIKVGDKTYVLQNGNEEVKGAPGDAVIVKLDGTEANAADIADKLAAAISRDEKNNGGYQATVNGDKLIISESTNRAQKVLDGELKAGFASDIVSTKPLTVGGGTSQATGTLATFDAAKMTSGTSVTVGGKTYTFVDSDDKKVGANETKLVYDKEASSSELAQMLADALEKDGLTGVSTEGASVKLADTDIGTNTKVSAGGVGLTLQIGDTADEFNRLSVRIDSTSTASLGIDNVDITTQDGAVKAIDMLKNAINTVSSTRGDLGAVQNRLEHTINNLSVTTENMTAAESRIRDVDMAKEMMSYTKNNILVQASQAMLAQANQVPQGVLQLLG